MGTTAPNDSAFPPLTRSTVLACAVQSWLPRFRRCTPKTTVIALPPDFFDYLDADGIFIPDGSAPAALEGQVSELSDSDDDAAGSDGSSVGDAPSFAFPEIDARIREVIERYGGAVFPKLSWSRCGWIGGACLTQQPARRRVDERRAAAAVSSAERRLPVAQSVRFRIARSRPRLRWMRRRAGEGGSVGHLPHPQAVVRHAAIERVSMLRPISKTHRSVVRQPEMLTKQRYRSATSISTPSSTTTRCVRPYSRAS